MGIPEHSIDTILDEYFQLDSPARDQRKGLGCGLSIVKLISKLLKNPLEVTSVVGEGSSSSFSVSVSEPTNDAVKTVTPLEAADERLNEPLVLFVDDG